MLTGAAQGFSDITAKGDAAGPAALAP